MSYPVWEAGKLYLPGALIQPATATVSTPQSLTNDGFESGDTGWTKGTGWTITEAAQVVAGTWSAKFGGGSPASLINNTQITVTPGQSVSTSCRVYLTTASSPSGAVAIIEWYTSGNALISYSTGTLINSGAGAWKTTSCTATAPATAAYAKVGVNANKSSGQGTIYADSFTVTAPTPAVTTGGLVFKAVQAEAGLSDDTEPTWPTVNGNTVVDNQVTWEAVLATRVVWEASPVLVSGGVEPTWPTTPGAVVIDGSIAWECRSTHITDENCPNSKVVAIMASKVFAADGDIVRFCATANPLDWSSERDAGYLPTGLQQSNANDMAVLNQYRSHLVGMNASTFQMWQVDPDPANMALLDQMEGVGSIYQGAAQPVANELLYLSQQGVRSVGIANAAENMQAGDIGAPIDPIVQEFLDEAPSSALSTYYPGAGQYWLCADAASGGATGMYLTGNAPDTYVGATYSYTYAATGGVAPITYAVTSGALPTGLSLSSAGVVSGTSTAIESQSFTVTATDADGRTASVADIINVFLQLTCTPYEPVDINWPSVVALLNFNGTDGSTTFTDETGITWTQEGSAQISSEQTKYCTGSGKFYTAAPMSLIKTTRTTDFDLPGLFTLEFDVYIDSAGAAADRTVFLNFTQGPPGAGNGGLGVTIGSDNKIRADSAGVATRLTSTAALPDDEWVHVALTRDASNNLRWWFDGVMDSEVVSTANFTESGSSPDVYIGAALLTSATNSLNGFLDNFRLTKGVCRYTATFTPPTSTHPSA